MESRDLSLAFKLFVNMTSHRDHAKLDASALNAFCTLAPLEHVVYYKLSQAHDSTSVWTIPWLTSGQVSQTPEHTQNNDTSLIDAHDVLQQLLHAGTATTFMLDASRQMLWIPLWSDTHLTACFCLSSYEMLDPPTVEALLCLAHVYRNHNGIIEYSTHDSLTGLLNRKTFDDRFSQIINDGRLQSSMPIENSTDRRAGSTLKEQWLAIIDIDHFKKVNDTFGHLYGDEVLILVANFMRASFRPSDYVFRFGGEEFVVLLRSATERTALAIFERFRRAVENYSFPQVGKVTISIGIVKVQLTTTPVMLLGHADQALYHAKTHGRNQVCQYDLLVANGQIIDTQSNNEVELF